MALQNRNPDMRPIAVNLLASFATAFLATAAMAESVITPFVGDYSGSAEVEAYDGSMVNRDMSVAIRETKEGFSIDWSSTTSRSEKATQKSYHIEFKPSDRDGVYAAAMTKNVFGHEVQLDPMKGLPYVWARIVDDTLTVFSLYVTAEGGYEIQQFDRSLAKGGLDLEFSRLNSEDAKMAVSTHLKRQ